MNSNFRSDAKPAKKAWTAPAVIDLDGDAESVEAGLGSQPEGVIASSAS